MGKNKTLVLITIIILLLALVGLFFYKSYKSVDYSKDYVSFITNSSNEIISKIDEVNTTINVIEYNESYKYEEDLVQKIDELNKSIEEIKLNKTKNYSSQPYNSDNLTNNFSEFIEASENLKTKYYELGGIIRNLGSKDDFYNKTKECTDLTLKLQEVTDAMTNELNNYSQNYQKIDFNRILNEI